MATSSQANGPQDVTAMSVSSQQQANNFEPLDKSSSNTLKVCNVL